MSKQHFLACIDKFEVEVAVVLQNVNYRKAVGKYLLPPSVHPLFVSTSMWILLTLAAVFVYGVLVISLSPSLSFSPALLLPLSCTGPFSRIPGVPAFLNMLQEFCDQILKKQANPVSLNQM